ncbi:hypothetical protein ACJX0J_006800, partial [Zea mays]
SASKSYHFNAPLSLSTVHDADAIYLSLPAGSQFTFMCSTDVQISKRCVSLYPFHY